MKRPATKVISLRLDDSVLRVVREVARLSGQNIEVVVAVLLAVGTLKHAADTAKKRKRS
jgi:hypothetical protein